MTDGRAQLQRSDRWETLKSSVFPLIGILIFLLIWEFLVGWFDIKSYLLPKPSEIILTMIDKYDLLWKHSLVTFYEMMAGYFLAIVVAVPLAIFMTASPTFDRFITPIILFLQTVPKIAIAPLFLVWFGVGTTPKVLVAFLICFFPILIDTSVGLRSVASEMIDLARSMGATRSQIFTRFRLPTSLPYLFSGLEGGSNAGRRRRRGRRICGS